MNKSIETSENWVFGYGSLIWNPGFPVQEVKPALLHGCHRALCIYSWVYRGTQEEPGLVMGLAEGGACRGVGLRVADDDWDAAVEYLRERELVTNVYREVVRPITILNEDQNRRVAALTFVADKENQQYASGLSFEETVRLVKRGHGKGGSNIDYVKNTYDHLLEMKVDDRALGKIIANL